MATVPTSGPEATMPPVRADLIPAAGLKCCPCTDLAIAGRHTLVDLALIAEAVTIVPSVQVFAVQGQQVAGVFGMPVCLECRKRQLKPVSKTGLLTA